MFNSNVGIRGFLKPCTAALEKWELKIRRYQKIKSWYSYWGKKVNFEEKESWQNWYTKIEHLDGQISTECADSEFKSCLVF